MLLSPRVELVYEKNRFFTQKSGIGKRGGTDIVHLAALMGVVRRSMALAGVVWRSMALMGVVGRCGVVMIQRSPRAPTAVQAADAEMSAFRDDGECGGHGGCGRICGASVDDP